MARKRKESLSEDTLNIKNETDEILEEYGIDTTEILEEAKKNNEDWQGYFNDNIEAAKNDMNFVLRDQWTTFERSEFTRLFKPAMTANKIYDPVKKIVGEQRKNKPDLIVRSLTGKASEEEIDLRADLVRTISYQSQNDLVYQNAFECALLGGFGAFQINLDYENPRSFNRIIKYSIIQDITKIAFDPLACLPHKGDGNFCSTQIAMFRKQFESTYPFVPNPVSYIDPRNFIDLKSATKDKIVICEYFKKSWFPLKLYLLSNGEAVTEDEWKSMQKEFDIKRKIGEGTHVAKDIIESQIPRIVGERNTQDYRIYHFRLIKDQIIEFSEWPSKHLPIIFVDGNSHYIEGTQYTRSFIKDVKDVQKGINYEFSEMIADLKNRRREQWIATPDNIIGYEQIWRNPELQIGALLAKPDQKTNAMPTRVPPWEMPQGILQMYQMNAVDIKEILGFSEANMQMESRDISGLAKRERKIEASMSSYVYMDNLNQAIEQGGRVVLDLLPYVYGENERIVNLSRKDGQSRTMTLNKKMNDGSIKNEMTKGDFDIEIDTGPSFAVQKEAALEMFSQVLQANPQTFNLIADLWAKNMDIQYMPQIVERFKTLVPPEILAKEEGIPPPPPQPNPQQEMMNHQMQLEMQKIKQKETEIRIKEQELALEQQKIELQAMKEKAQFSLSIHDTNEKHYTAKIGKAVELHKAKLEYDADLAKIAASIHNKKPAKPMY
jgi:hypothetical protein